ncbi:MAG: hypothetical protein JW927_08505 [Deltaproteobacteria bacterium]|nr:hypothetical protein [Deltaproteobacteria bacterium]
MIKYFLCAGLITLLWISTSFADGDSRKSTPDEKAFTLKVFSTFENALPEPHDGWEMVGKTDIMPPDYVVSGQEEFPMRVDYFIKWQDSAKINAAKAEINQQLISITKKQNAVERMKESTAEMDRLAKEFGKAFETKDNAKIEAIQKQINEISKKINEQGAADKKVIDQKIAELTPHDIELRVDFSANLFYQQFMDIPAKQDVFEGCKIFRIDELGQTEQGWREGSTYIFIGYFNYVKQDSNPYMEAKPIPGILHTKVQTVVIRITGEKNRAQEFIKKMDLKAIKSLMGS